MHLEYDGDGIVNGLELNVNEWPMLQLHWDSLGVGTGKLEKKLRLCGAVIKLLIYFQLHVLTSLFT